VLIISRVSNVGSDYDYPQ